jgi:hypothetical protein
MSGITYLASPYTHELASVRQQRFEQAVDAAAMLMREGRVVFCPIAHSHDIGKVLGESTSFEFWMSQDIPILRMCDEVMVLCLDGWENSRGVQREMAIAQAVGIPVTYMDPV